MDIKRWNDEFVSLKTDDEKKDFDTRFRKEVESLSKDERITFENTFVEMAKKDLAEAKDLIKIAKLANILKPILPYISFSGISTNYFNRTRQWFYQRLNGNIVKGKTAKFTNEELIKLSDALKDISENIKRASDEIRSLN